MDETLFDKMFEYRVGELARLRQTSNEVVILGRGLSEEACGMIEFYIIRDPWNFRIHHVTVAEIMVRDKAEVITKLRE